MSNYERAVLLATVCVLKDQIAVEADPLRLLDRVLRTPEEEVPSDNLPNWVRSVMADEAVNGSEGGLYAAPELNLRLPEREDDHENSGICGQRNLCQSVGKL